MQHPLRVAAALACLLVVSLAAEAGTQEAPEVTDPAADQTINGQPDAGNRFTNADVLAAWIDNETAESFEVHLQVSGAGTFTTTTTYSWTVTFTIAGTEYAATTTTTFGVAHPTTGAPVVGGVSTYSGVATGGSQGGGIISMTVPKSNVGSPAGGTITGIFAGSAGNPGGVTQATVADRAPDTGFGADYALSGGTGTSNPFDSDADGLNDTWEQQNLGGLGQNATGDPDADGCNNKCEFDADTNPTRPDTDGDGCSDGEEVQAGTNPKDPSSHPAACATPGPGTTTTSGPPTTGTTTTGPPGTTTTGTDDPGSPGDEDASQRLQDGFKEGAFGVGYLIIASALALVVIILSLVGRGGRWGL